MYNEAYIYSLSFRYEIPSLIQDMGNLYDG